MGGGHLDAAVAMVYWCTMSRQSALYVRPCQEARRVGSLVVVARSGPASAIRGGHGDAVDGLGDAVDHRLGDAIVEGGLDDAAGWLSEAVGWFSDAVDGVGACFEVQLLGERLHGRLRAHAAAR